jgi:D-sedoheptulose 7-phosphate isomerase
VAISSSGRSKNILKAVDAVRARGMAVATFSGFRPGNPLRARGGVNLCIGSNQYGFVEIAHLVLLHAILDLYIMPAMQTR